MTPSIESRSVRSTLQEWRLSTAVARGHGNPTNPASGDGPSFIRDIINHGGELGVAIFMDGAAWWDTLSSLRSRAGGLLLWAGRRHRPVAGLNKLTLNEPHGCDSRALMAISGEMATAKLTNLVGSNPATVQPSTSQAIPGVPSHTHPVDAGFADSQRTPAGTRSAS